MKLINASAHAEETIEREAEQKVNIMFKRAYEIRKIRRKNKLNNLKTRIMKKG